MSNLTTFLIFFLFSRYFDAANSNVCFGFRPFGILIFPVKVASFVLMLQSISRQFPAGSIEIKHFILFWAWDENYILRKDQT